MLKYKQLYEALLEDSQKGNNNKEGATWVGLGDIREENNANAKEEHNTRVADKSIYHNSGSSQQQQWK